MKDIKVDIAYLGIIFIAFTLPFSVLINNIAIIISILPILFGLIIDKSFRSTLFSNIKNNKITVLLVAFFAMYIVSALIHWNSYENIPLLYSDLEKRVIFLVIPIVFAVVPMLTEDQVKNVLRSFFLAIMLSTIISLLVAGYVTIATENINNMHPRYGIVENNFMYHRLGSYLNFHAVYFSSMVLMGFILAIVYFRYHFVKASTWQKGLMVFVLIYLLAFLFLLKSAVILIGLMLIVSSYALFHLYRNRKKLGFLSIAIFVIGVVVLISTLGYRVVEKVGSRGNFLAYDFTEPGGGQWNVFNLRKAKWDVALEAIGENWLIGVGPGNIYSILDKYYNKHDFNFALREHYNPHNQFLHSFLTLGILGFVTLTSVYLLAFYNSVRRIDLVWFLFMIGFTLFSMSESTLAVNKGIIFFVFFTSFFSYLPRKTSYYFR